MEVLFCRAGRVSRRPGQMEGVKTAEFSSEDPVEWNYGKSELNLLDFC